MGKVKTPIGLLGLKFYPVKGTGYDTAVDLGSSVKAYLSVETSELTIYGDDVLELDFESFKRGTLSTETWFDDLELETKIFGGAYSSEDSDATDASDDVAPDGAVSYIRKILKKDPTTNAKSTVYRAIVLPLCTASKASQKEEADTKGDSLDPKTHPVDFYFRPNAAGKWRYRADFDTQAAAEGYIATKTAAASTG